MPFSIFFTVNSEKKLSNIDKAIQKRIKVKLEKLDTNPILFVKRLKGVELFSLRVGDYRVILDINLTGQKITIIDIEQLERFFGTLNRKDAAKWKKEVNQGRHAFGKSRLS